MSESSITEVVFKDEILNYTGKQFHTSPKDAKAFLEKQGIAIIPNVLDENECHQMNEGEENKYEGCSKILNF